VREALVNHISGESRSGVAGVYNRYHYWDEMAEAVATYEAWFQRTIIREPAKQETPGIGMGVRGKMVNNEELTLTIPHA
jgi:hypothetical protein